MDWFAEVGAGRDWSHGFASVPQRLTYRELQAWAETRGEGQRPSAFEVECLRLIDAEFMAAWSAEQREQARRKGKPRGEATEEVADED